MWESRIFKYAKTKTQISFPVTAKLISAFVFATWIVQSLSFLNTKFQASSHFLWLRSLICVRHGRKHEDRFSQVVADLIHSMSKPAFCIWENKGTDQLWSSWSETLKKDFLVSGLIWAATWEYRIFAYAKTKTEISFTVITKLISAFVFATLIVQSLPFLNTKFQASSSLLWLYSPVCVEPGRKPRRQVFWRRGSSNTN